ncbi:MAG: hypothetical protein IPG60_09735 [Bacteroidetes bacterium]|nr:hypothetical protein [Bacteroidota bacterium]MBP7398286.1 hypothetical protein [Chitinophagales bacterium]MBK7108717.1 hypothetical protein [Bacteroidota bacterium]MBK8488956.1 hypothetical protein [Bacteroidota bacterium]MBP8753598.1 hypothetical protein [Chitinophagales bacterium]
MKTPTDNHQIINTDMQYDRPYNDEINIGDLFKRVGEYRKYLLKKWWVILIFAIVFGYLLRFYVVWRPEHYIAHSDFSVKGVEGSSTSSLASLASSFGIGISTGSEFTNDYFLGLIQSRRVIKNALLLKDTVQLKGEAPRVDYMVNFYLEMYPRWSSRKKINDFKIIHGDINALSIYEDSVLSVIYDEIIDADLTVTFNEEIGLNQLEFSSLNRDFSRIMANNLASDASEFYIYSQIDNEISTVSLIQDRADSVRLMMQVKEDALARSQDQSAFTVKAAGLLNQGRLLRDIEILTLEYSTIYTQLELAKFDMRNKTPLISVVDSPNIATIKEKEQKITFLIIGIILGTFLSVVFLSIRKYYKDTLAEAEEKQLLIADFENKSKVISKPDGNDLIP